MKKSGNVELRVFIFRKLEIGPLALKFQLAGLADVGNTNMAVENFIREYQRVMCTLEGLKVNFLQISIHSLNTEFDVFHIFLRAFNFFLNNRL